MQRFPTQKQFPLFLAEFPSAVLICEDSFSDVDFASSILSFLSGAKFSWGGGIISRGVSESFLTAFYPRSTPRS